MLVFLKICAAASIIILIVGLIKPSWILFFMKHPDRLTVTSLAMVMFMASWTHRSSEDVNQLQLNRQ